MALRCLIVDDNPSFLEAATTLLERQGLTVVGVASTSDEAVREVEALHPDVVLVDLGLGRESGLDLAHRLARLDSGKLAVILISTQEEVDVADLIEGVPAAGFASKSVLSASLIRRLANAPRER